MSKNKKVMSIAIMPEMHDELKSLAKRKGLSASNYIGNLVEQALKINPDDDALVVGKPADEEIVAVMLKIPKSLTGDHDKLKDWLDSQSNGILKAMTQK